MSPRINAAIRRAFFFSVIFLLTLIPAVAEETPAPAQDDEIVITATRVPEKSIEVPQYVTVISSDEIESSGKQNIAAVVADEAGILQYDQGPSGGLKNLWIRGASGARVLVLLDGVPLNNARDGQVDLSLIPTAIIEKIEIVQGGMSIVYGSDAIGGVVNIITKKELPGKSLLELSYVSTSYIPGEYTDGSLTYNPDPSSLYDGKSFSLSAAHDFGFMSMMGTGNFTQADNGYYYSQGNDLFRRINASALGGNGMLCLSFPWETGNADIKGFFSARNSGIPGSLSWATPDASQEDMQLEVIALWSERSFFSKDLTLDARVSVAQSDRTYYSTPSTPSKTALTTATVDLHQKYAAAEFLSVVYGGNFAMDHIQSEYLGNRDRIHGSIFTSLPFLAGSSVEITPTVRYDLYSDIGGDISWGLGAVVFVSDSSSFKFSVTKSFRTPTLYDLYDPWASNPALKPESGYSADIGFSLLDAGIRAETAIFARLMADEIKSYPPLYIPYNMESSFYTGAQAHLEWEFVREFFLETDGTFIYSFDLSGGNTLADDIRIPLVPMWKASLAFRWQSEILTARLGVSFTGDRYVDNTMTTVLPVIFVLDASLRYKTAEWLSFFIAADNLLDADYELVRGYPMPGLTIRLGIEMSL